MDGEEFYGAAYKGSKQFPQQEVKTANATGLVLLPMIIWNVALTSMNNLSKTNRLLIFSA